MSVSKPDFKIFHPNLKWVHTFFERTEDELEPVRKEFTDFFQNVDYPKQIEHKRRDDPKNYYKGWCIKSVDYLSKTIEYQEPIEPIKGFKWLDNYRSFSIEEVSKITNLSIEELCTINKEDFLLDALEHLNRICETIANHYFCYYPYNLEKSIGWSKEYLNSEQFCLDFLHEFRNLVIMSRVPRESITFERDEKMFASKQVFH